MNTAASFAVPPDIQQVQTDLIALRRHLHMHPELSNREFETQRFVLDTLASYGIPAVSIAETGVLATLQGATRGPSLLLRADMDALPIEETTQLPFRSRTPGVMHACGHDAHMAMMLTAARILKQRGLCCGSVRVLFQPAEEGGGGARSVVEAGVLRDPKPDGALALHVWSPYRTGEIAVIDGPAMAAVDGFEIAITGSGTHGAAPENGVDPIAIAALFINAAQQLISRRISAHRAAVLSFCSINGGTAFNIIPENVRILGTLRTFEKSVRRQILAELQSLVTQLPASMGATGEMTVFESHCATVNSPMMTAIVRDVAANIAGSSVTRPLPLMAGEDFGLILDEIPGAMVFVGCGGASPAAAPPHHHPGFTVDEACLPIGVALLVEVATSFLEP